MSNIEKYGFHVVPNAVGKETCELISRSLLLFRSNYNYENNLSDESFKGDGLVEKSFSKYGVNCLEALSEILMPKVEEVVSKRLAPTYTYSRIYFNGAEMQEHTDRPSCQYSATLTLSISDKPWEIHFRDITKKERAISLDVGSMCVYRGMDVPHWRNRYEGKEQIQAFIHYVDIDGPYAKFKYDGRPMLGLHPSTRRKDI
jgi:hypothetical protein